MEVVAFQTFSMQTLTYAQARLAAFLFFSASGLAYGLFTARIPSLKEQTGAASDELGPWWGFRAPHTSCAASASRP